MHLTTQKYCLLHDEEKFFVSQSEEITAMEVVLRQRRGGMISNNTQVIDR